ncbi:hypothetical protein BE221DRAFT_61183, partial [Ostreococcus tauri]
MRVNTCLVSSSGVLGRRWTIRARSTSEEGELGAFEALPGVQTTTTWGGDWAEFVVFMARLRELGYT